MWDKKKTMGISNTEIKFDETYKISKVYTVEDWWDEVDENWFPAYEAYLVDSQGVEAIDYLDNINMWLKPEFKVVKPLFESEEEFNVDAPKEWDVTELGVGDIITNDMWNPNTTNGKHFFDWIAFEEDGWEIIGIENDQEGDDRFYVTIMGVDSKLDFNDWLDKFNDYLKPQFKIYRSLNESENEYGLPSSMEVPDGASDSNPEDEWYGANPEEEEETPVDGEDEENPEGEDEEKEVTLEDLKAMIEDLTARVEKLEPEEEEEPEDGEEAPAEGEEEAPAEGEEAAK
jgi:hypothetical protein